MISLFFRHGMFVLFCCIEERIIKDFLRGKFKNNHQKRPIRFPFWWLFLLK